MKDNEKIQKFVIIGIVFAAILFISITAFLANGSSNSAPNSEEPIPSESASTQMGKKAEDAKNELANEFEAAALVPNSNEAETISANETASIETEKNKEENPTTETTAEATNIENTSKELTFKTPISGKIIREFARESLVYSDTLKEWITHNGVDIKADKTSVVSSSADGKVYAIKNDPRYGLTVIINHANGYQTIYSNLLTAEFVVEGEDVTAGQSIGTVGNSASFEILDDYHLHFELLKDNEYLDPTIYINFE